MAVLIEREEIIAGVCRVVKGYKGGIFPFLRRDTLAHKWICLYTNAIPGRVNRFRTILRQIFVVEIEKERRTRVKRARKGGKGPPKIENIGLFSIEKERKLLSV